MIDFITVALTLMTSSHNMPIYFDTAQKKIGRQVIDQAHKLGEDPYTLMAIAWHESRIQKGKTSHTGDVGIFQINWRFWGKKIWKYKSYQQFVEDIDKIATYARRDHHKRSYFARKYKSWKSKE